MWIVFALLEEPWKAEKLSAYLLCAVILFLNHCYCLFFMIRVEMPAWNAWDCSLGSMLKSFTITVTSMGVIQPGNAKMIINGSKPTETYR